MVVMVVLMIAHLEVLSWRPGQSHERWERPAPGLADGVLLELEDEEDEEADVCEGRGAGSESASEVGEEAIERFFLAPLQVQVNLLAVVYSP